MTFGALCLQTGPEGHVWYAGDDGQPVDAGQVPGDFITRIVSVPASVCVIGRLDNAELILRILREMRLGRWPVDCKVHIGNPMMCPAGATMQTVLAQMWLYGRTHGDIPIGWYQLTLADLPIYALRAATLLPALTDDVVTLLEAHPAWPAISFVPTHSPAACIEILSHIGDVRWYRHPGRPGRPSRLFSHCGADPGNMYDLAQPSFNIKFATGKLRAAYYAVSAWRAGLAPIDGESIRMFLTRISVSHQSQLTGMLAATKCFLRFMSEVWSGHFEPKRFFLREEEAAAYVQHLRAIDAARLQIYHRPVSSEETEL